MGRLARHPSSLRVGNRGRTSSGSTTRLTLPLTESTDWPTPIRSNKSSWQRSTITSRIAAEHEPIEAPTRNRPSGSLLLIDDFSIQPRVFCNLKIAHIKHLQQPCQFCRYHNDQDAKASRMTRHVLVQVHLGTIPHEKSPCFMVEAVNDDANSNRNFLMMSDVA